MKMKLLLPLALGAGILASAMPAFAATPVAVGTDTTDLYFDLTGASTPYTPSITAKFGATTSGPFDYDFNFTIPQNGIGSGNVSASFSSLVNELTITDVIVDGKSYTPLAETFGSGSTVSGFSFVGVPDIPIKDDVQNTIEVIGNTANGATGTFSGNATFSATSAAPEPATWLLMIGGIGVIGAVLRRRTTPGVVFA
jgi:hypothetical protein